MNETTNPEEIILKLRKKLVFYKLLSACCILVLLIEGSIFLFPRVFHPKYAIQVNGRTAALAINKSEAESVLRQIRTEKAGELGNKSDFSQRIKISPRFFTKRKALNEAELRDILNSKLTLKVPAAVILADDQPVVALPTEKEAQETLDQFKAKFSGSNTKVLAEPTFKEHLQIAKVSVDPSGVCNNVQEGLDALMLGDDNSTHVVSDGETGYSIAQKYDISFAELSQFNPGKNLDHLKVGDELNIGHGKPSLTVVTVEKRNFEEVIPFKTQRISNPEVFQGKTFVVQYGRSGKRLIQQQVTCENGVITERQQKSAQELIHPQDEIIRVGTKARH